MELETRNDESAEASSFPELYRSLLFLIALYIAGDLLCGRFLRIVPSLVGQIAVGVIFGPYVLDWVSPEWQILGEIGLVLLLCQAGLEMDFETLQAIGPRGGIMAIVGSILPMTIGFVLSCTVLNLDLESAISAGCSFGPTSAGIAMNVLDQCGVLKSKVGQLIVAIAIIDDIFALVVLSQLRALAGEVITVASIAIPIVSAILWLVVGGVVALYVMPTILEKLHALERKLFGKIKGEDENNDDDDVEGTAAKENQSSSLWHVGILLFALLPATFYSEASYLLGAFLAGLSACQEKQTADAYNQHLAKIIQWLMRVFFGASIAFEIPILLFDNGTVIGNGFILSLSLLGKIMTGLLLTPVIAKDGRRWDWQHSRDCAIVGFSMAGEAEFAFLVASFGLSEGLLSQEVYASVVFAILLSTIVSPVLLRTTLALFPNKESNNDTANNASENTPELELSRCEENLQEVESDFKVSEQEHAS
jgi:Kef-type K+ transport system membrane component KefB